jgi:serine/threonine-protein kinase
MNHASDITPGSLIASRYEVQSLLGRGGMGAVYRAVDRLLGDMVALKVLDAGIASEETALRFRDEIRLARRVSHRNVCRIHEYGEDDAFRYISMAFVDGADLKRILREQGPLPPAEAYAVAVSIAAGLQAIHDEGIIHRDLKTSNVMRSRAGVVQLMDFGIAKDALKSSAARLTCTGTVMGTPEYMSPEQAMGKPADARSDLYALGIVVYELFTAGVPFHAETPVAVLLQQVQEPVRLDVEEAARVPAALKPVLARALAKAPEDRFASADDLGEAILRASHAKGTTDSTDRIVLPAQWPPLQVAAPNREAAGRRVRPRPRRLHRLLASVTLTTAAVAAALLGAVWAREHVSGSPAPLEAEASLLAASTEDPSPPVSMTPALPVASPLASPADVGSLDALIAVAPAPTPSPSDGPAKGTLRVIVVPWADVSIDGRPIRSAALRGVRLSPGEHSVTLSHPDYTMTTRRVVIGAGKTTDLVVDLSEEGSRR